MKMPWIKGSDGNKSASLTFSVIAFIAVTGWLIAWVVGVGLGTPVPAFDAGTAMSYLTPILGLYWGRRFTDKREHTKRLEVESKAQNSQQNQ